MLSIGVYICVTKQLYSDNIIVVYKRTHSREAFSLTIILIQHLLVWAGNALVICSCFGRQAFMLCFAYRVIYTGFAVVLESCNIHVYFALLLGLGN